MNAKHKEDERKCMQHPYHRLNMVPGEGTSKKVSFIFRGGGGPRWSRNVTIPPGTIMRGKGGGGGALKNVPCDLPGISRRALTCYNPSP